LELEIDGSSEFSWWKRLQLRLISVGGATLVRLVNSTVRFVAEDRETFDSLRARGPVVYSFWHNQLLSASYYFRGLGIVVLVSQHFDGACIAGVISRFGFRTARGSSTRGGIRALKEMTRWVDKGGEVAVTADGPRGPVYEAKPGPIFVARKNAAPILCFQIEPRDYWTLGSWDRLRIPKPFTTALVKIGEPLWIPEEESSELSLARLQAEMDRLKRYSEGYWEQRLN
jgi:lysophospholipid acyltransferase (LPLAT)-like uncharacterized protein